MTRYPVPEIFQIPDRFLYPADNTPDFEYWFMHNLTDAEILLGDRIYLPILFTSYFKANGYGKNQVAIDHLQGFVDTLPGDVKYFCIVQFDDGVLIDWKGKDMKVFGMSGKPEGCIPIPLVCQPHKFKFTDYPIDILCSFVGRATDPIRKKILEWGPNKAGCYIKTEHHSLEKYCEILARSRFVLCPRGYGASSFRIAESLQYGAEPIVLINEGDNVFEKRYFSVQYGSVNDSILDTLHRHMMSMANIPSPLCTPLDIYRQCYTFESVKKIILDGLWNLL